VFLRRLLEYDDHASPTSPINALRRHQTPRRGGGSNVIHRQPPEALDGVDAGAAGRNPDKVVNAGALAKDYEGSEELLYERLERQYESVPGGPFRVWRDAAEPEL
jgi:hypothetical protein